MASCPKHAAHNNSNVMRIQLLKTDDYKTQITADLMGKQRIK